MAKTSMWIVVGKVGNIEAVGKLDLSGVSLMQVFEFPSWAVFLKACTESTGDGIRQFDNWHVAAAADLMLRFTPVSTAAVH